MTFNTFPMAYHNKLNGTSSQLYLILHVVSARVSTLSIINVSWGTYVSQRGGGGGHLKSSCLPVLLVQLVRQSLK